MSEEQQSPAETRWSSWKYGQVEITLDRHGYFNATVNGDQLSDDTKTGLQTKIDKALDLQAKQQNAKLGLKVVGVLYGKGYSSRGEGKVHHDTLRAINRTTGKGIFLDATPKDQVFEYICVDVPGAEEALQQMLSALEQLDAAKKAVSAFMFQTSAGHGVTAENYPQIVQAVIASYNKAKGAAA